MTGRVLVVGGGFGGFHCQRRLARLLPAGAAELMLVSPTDYLLYSPLLPDVTSGAVEPRHIAVSLRQSLPRTRCLLGGVTAIDLAAHTAEVTFVTDGGQPGGNATLEWDRLVLAPGSVTRQFDIPGVADNGHGVKTLQEATYLRDHLIQQLDHADELPPGPERSERLTVVAVGAGYSSTEIVARLQHWVQTAAARWERLHPEEVTFILVDIAHMVLPELGSSLGDVAMKALQRRGIDVRLGVSVRSATDRSVTLTDGAVVPTRTLIWGAGVVASPLVQTLDLPLQHGRLVVDDQLRVAGQQYVWAVGDAAAVSDLTKTTEDGNHPATPPTAQHAQRQGRAVARNVAATLGVGRPGQYRHRDLGLVADLGGWDSVARPLGVPLRGLPAKAITRGYHLMALPGAGNRVRVAADWLLSAVLPAQAVQLSEVRSEDARISRAQHTDGFAAAD